MKTRVLLSLWSSGSILSVRESKGSKKIQWRNSLPPSTSSPTSPTPRKWRSSAWPLLLSSSAWLNLKNYSLSPGCLLTMSSLTNKTSSRRSLRVHPHSNIIRGQFHCTELHLMSWSREMSLKWALKSQMIHKNSNSLCFKRLFQCLKGSMGGSWSG